MENALSANISEKRYHLDKNYIDSPVCYGDLSLLQIGRLHCTEHTVVGMHTHRNWFELTVVTDGEGTVACENKILSLNKGSSFFIGANSGKLELRGNFSLIVCEP